MPNICDNTLYVYGPLKAALALKEDVASDERVFDFNELIPMPEELKRIQIGSTEIGGKRFLRWITTAGENGEPRSVGITPEMEAELIAKHGAADWYDWAIKNWGTKWNAGSPVISGSDLEYFDEERIAEFDSLWIEWKFETAWGPPAPILEHLRDKYPELDIKLLFLIEGGWEGSGVL